MGGEKKSGLTKLEAELLAALRDLTKYAAVDSGKGHDEEGYAAFAAARAAIAKAEGK